MLQRAKVRLYLPGLVVGSALLAACGAKVNVPPEAPQAVRRGDEAYRYHDYEGAIGNYTAHTELIEKDEYTARALYKTALSQYRLGRYREAIETLDDLHRRYPDARWVQVDALRGDTERALGHSESAIEAWDQGWEVANDNDRSKLRVRVATVARGMSNLELAQTRQSAKSDEIQQILEDQIEKRARPEIDEPIPDFDAVELEPEIAAPLAPTPKSSKPGAGLAKAGKAAPTALPEAVEAAEVAPATVEEDAGLAVAVAAAAPATGKKDTSKAVTATAAKAETKAPVAAAPAGAALPATADTKPVADADVPTSAGRIAVILPMSGLEALTGERVLGAIRLVFDPSLVVIRDAQETSAAALRAFDELTRDPNILAVIGPLDEETAGMLTPKAAAARLPLLTLSPAREAAPPYVLQAGSARPQLVGKLLDYAINRARLRRFGVVYPNDVSGQSFVSAFKAQVDKRGGTIIGTDGYAPDAKSLTAGLVHRWRDDENLQALVLSDGPLAAGNFARFLQREMPDILLLGVSNWDSLTGADQALSGVVFTSAFYPNGQRQAVRDFVGRYEQTYGRTPGSLEAEAYDAALLLKHALDEGARSRLAVWQKLQATKDMEGATGDLAVTPEGVRRQVVVLQLVNGKLIELDAPAQASTGKQIAAH